MQRAPPMNCDSPAQNEHGRRRSERPSRHERAQPAQSESAEARRGGALKRNHYQAERKTLVEGKTLIARLRRLPMVALLTAIALVDWFAPPAAYTQSGAGQDSAQLLSIDHYVRHESTVPAMAGEVAQLYVRERVKASILARGPASDDRVVLFVHGAG